MALNTKYLRDGEILLAQGDYSQASEKFWGAVTTLVKAAAVRRRWQHSTHRDLHVIVDRLFQETGDTELVRLFAAAESLHANFYEDFLTPEVVQHFAGQTKRLIEKFQR